MVNLRARSPCFVVAATIGLVALVTHSPANAAPGDTTRVSVTSAGGQGNDWSGNPDVNGDARFVVFDSPASNLVENDTNGVIDVYLRDVQAGTTVRMSVSSSGVQGNAKSRFPIISSDGRFVGFTSEASNLVANDTNGAPDGFVRDRQTGVTERVTIGPEGQQPNYGGSVCGISANGRYVAMSLQGTNIGAGDTEGQLFVRDRQAGTTTLVSVSTDGLMANADSSDCAVSGDGRYVAFVSRADNLVPNDTNEQSDVFLRDRQTDTTERVSLNASGAAVSDYLGTGKPSISADGRYVAFQSLGGREIYVRDVWSGTTKIASLAIDGSRTYGNEDPALSADGRYVAFSSYASNLVPRDPNRTTDIFRRDLQAGVTEIISVGPNGAATDSFAWRPQLSADGQKVVFDSTATNLVANDTNESDDVFLHEAGGAGVSKIGYTVKPASLEFGSVTLGTNRTLKFWLRNTGTRDIEIFDSPIDHFLVRGQDRSQYFVRTTCGYRITVGATCAVEVTFKPTSAGVKRAVVRVILEDVVRSRSVTGTGAAAP